MENDRASGRTWFELIILAVLFSAVGLLIVVVFSQYRPLLSGIYDLAGRVSLILILLSASLLARRSKVLHKYWQILFGFFIMVTAVSLDWWMAGIMLNRFGSYTDTPAGLALEKLKTVLIVTITVILLTRLSGESLGSIYFQRGDLKRGLTIGGIAFAVAAVGSIPISRLFFSAGEMSSREVLAWSPWILILVLANATNEELLFRGLFLKKLEPFYGKFFANLVIVFVFTGLHLGVTYTIDQMLFLAILVPLSLVWGYIMQKTNSLWGSILFHAGTDIPVFLAIFSTRF